MILTGKAREDFEKWLFMFQESIFKGIFLDDEQDVLDEFDILPEICKYALIAEWFASVGIYINTELDYLHSVWFPTINNNWNFEEVEFKTRPEAIKEAIKKANEIYNNKN